MGETILKSCLPISTFKFFLLPFNKILQNMWTGGQNGKILRKQFQAHLFCRVKVWTLGKKLPFYFMFSLCLSKNWQKVWTGGQVMKIMKKIFLTSCIFLFASVDMWTKRCFSISYFLSVMYSSQFWQKSVDRWTNNENYEKKIQSLLSYSLKVQTCGQVVVILFYFFFLPFKILTKNVDRWKEMKFSEKK